MRMVGMMSLAAISLAVGSLVSGCAGHGRPVSGGEARAHMEGSVHGASAAVEQKHENMWTHVNEAVAVIYPTKGNSASGAIYFTSTGQNSVHVHGSITGLAPNSTHALHVHEFGDQSSEDGTSAGSHFNPEGHKHGEPGKGEHHAGDFGNITADGSGKATVDLTVSDLSVAGLKNPVIGRGLVVHAKADDFSQPVGNAGGRIGVGVIGVAKAEPAK